MSKKKAVAKPKVKQTSITRRAKRKQGQSLIRTAPVRLTSAITEDGLIVNEKLLVLRVGYLLNLTSDLTTKALASHWTEMDFLLYLTKDQPSFAYKAWMFCSDCHLSLQRDHSGSEHIGGRGLKTKQKKSKTNQTPTENVTRILVPAPIKPDPTTLPKRGPKAKLRRELIERSSIQNQLLETGLSVDSLTTPASELSFKTDRSHRPLELRSGIGSPIQPENTFNPGNLRPPRPLNGLRSAYLGLIKCSPIPGEYLTQNLKP